jgi:hypothetical protein
MTHRHALTITSVLSILLFTLHWADDVARGIDKGGGQGWGGMLVLAVWLYATLMLAERRSGLVIIMVASLLAALVTVFHMQGAIFGGRAANPSGVFFWVWTLIALGVTATFSVILSARSLWSLRRAPAPRSS